MRREETLFGTSIAAGLAVGPAHIYRDVLQRDLQFYDIEPHQVENELARFDEASKEVLNDLRLAAERIEQTLDSQLADVFRVHEQILFDPALRQDLEQTWSRTSSTSSKWFALSFGAGLSGCAE